MRFPTEAFFEVLRFDGLAIPTHGPTGSPVVQVEELSGRNNYQAHHFLPRMPPSRDEELPVYDDDYNFVDSRPMTDEEFASAVAATERWNAYFERTGGTHIAHHGTDYELTVTCRDRSIAKARGDGLSWQWTDLKT